jgi:hypothetical protein
MAKGPHVTLANDYARHQIACSISSTQWGAGATVQVERVDLR